MNLLIIIRPIYVVYAIKNICYTYNETHCDLKTYIFFYFVLTIKYKNLDICLISLKCNTHLQFIRKWVSESMVKYFCTSSWHCSMFTIIMRGNICNQWIGNYTLIMSIVKYLDMYSNISLFLSRHLAKASHTTIILWN